MGRLLRPEDGDGQEAWAQFLFNLEMARSLVMLPTETVSALLFAGANWSGSGWTTSKASRVLYGLTQIPLVASVVSAYSHAWLFALSIVANLEVSGLDLNDRASEAAFALASLISGEAEQAEGEGERRSAQQTANGAEENENANEGPTFDWEELPVELPVDLQKLYARFTGPTGQKFDIKFFFRRNPIIHSVTSESPREQSPR